MIRRLFLNLGLALMLIAGAAAGWAQTDAPAMPLPPPPPDGQFFYVHSEGMIGDLAPVKGAPFSAKGVTETTQVLADGNQINRTETSQLYRDSSGRSRHESTLSLVGPWAAAKTPRQIVNISDPVGGFNYMLDVNEKTAVKLPFHAGPGHMKEAHALMMAGGGDMAMAGAGGEVTIQRSIAGPDGPAPTAVAPGNGAEPDNQSKIQRTTESLGTQQMAGVTAQGTRTTETIPAGLIGNESAIVTISERWYSPDLHTTVYSKRTDPRFGTTVYQLTGITRAEPDASLFQVPPDYTISDKPRMMQMHDKLPAE